MIPETSSRVAQLARKHGALLDRALSALKERGAWCPYVEAPSRKVYGETAKAEGEAAFRERLGGAFPLDQPGRVDLVGSESSPWGIPLDIRYARSRPAALVTAARLATDGWSRSKPRERAAVLAEILERLNRASFEMAYATMHTTGQGFVMAFQAGGPHAQDRGLEAVAQSLRAMEAIPASASWSKRMGRDEEIRLLKTFRIVPRGVGLVIGCSTFPTWNSYPALFANLATGNACIVKPHPGAVLPLALSVAIARDELASCGFDPNLVTLAVDTPEEPVAQRLATDDGVALVDYTGGSEFGSWLEANVRQAVVSTEKAGVNPVVLDSVDDFGPVAANLAFGLSLYSGQMCTASQNIFVPRDGIATGTGRLSFDAVGERLTEAIDRLLGDEARAADLLGGIKSDATAERVDAAAREPGVRIVRASSEIVSPAFPEARIRSPLVLAVDAERRDLFMREMFGPVTYLVATSGTEESLALASESARLCGAISAAIWSVDEAVLATAEDAMAEAGAALSCNLSGSIWVNQAAAFSDFHVSGLNPAGNATLCDADFVTRRFRVAQSRRPAPAADGGGGGEV